MSRSRRKLDTSPIEYDDVVDSPAMKGMVSFLDFPPGELPKLDFTRPEPDQPEKGIPQPNEGVPQTVAIETGIPTQAAPPLLITPDSSTPVEGIPLLTPPQSMVAAAPQPPSPGVPLPPLPVQEPPRPPAPGPWPPVLPRPLTRIRRATLAQDGHSFGEQALYDALWQHAHPRDNDTRIVTLGYRRMSEMARLTVNNCKANIQALIQKLAVEEASTFTHSQGRTYLVYNYAAIIHRRREAGLTHYIKSRGVVFVDPDTGAPLTARIRDRSGIPFSGGPPSTTVPEGDTKGIPEAALSGAPDSPAPPYSQLVRNSSSNPTSSTPAGLIQGLRQIIDPVDDEAAAVLWHQCKKRSADCTVEEVLYFARAKATLFRSGKIQNPIGFLLTAVPKCFEGASFLEFRREQAQRTREAEEQTAQMRREFEAILNDPGSSEEDRQFVRRMLAEQES